MAASTRSFITAYSARCGGADLLRGRRRALVDFRELDPRICAHQRSYAWCVGPRRQLNDMHADLFNDADATRAVLAEDLVELLEV